LKLNQIKSKQNKKNEKLVHGVILCDIVARRNNKLAIWHFGNNLFTKNAIEVCSPFYPNGHIDCKMHYKLSYNHPNLNIDMHLVTANNVANEKYSINHACRKCGRYVHVKFEEKIQ
jgi:hypothetical protein